MRSRLSLQAKRALRTNKTSMRSCSRAACDPLSLNPPHRCSRHSGDVAAPRRVISGRDLREASRQQPWRPLAGTTTPPAYVCTALIALSYSHRPTETPPLGASWNQQA